MPKLKKLSGHELIKICISPLQCDAEMSLVSHAKQETRFCATNLDLVLKDKKEVM